MPALLSGSSLAICRAGGTTLAELAAAGTPALLLPYPHAADDHQRKNAEVYVAAGAAQMLDEREVTARLDDQLAEMLGRTRERRRGPQRLSLAACAASPAPRRARMWPRSSGRWSPASAHSKRVRMRRESAGASAS